jgi:hypothetical protein
MKTINDKYYRCDHCNRAIVSKGSMVVHEKNCKENPNNKHMCFQWCKNLIRTVDQVNYNAEDNSYNGKEISFKCLVTKKEMYSYKLERFKSNKGRIKGLERMPLECQYYKYAYDIEDDTEF